MADYWVRVSVSTYEELFILQEHIYDILEDILNEGKGLFCLASWWWYWGFPPAVRDRANSGANWCWVFDNTPALINQRNIYISIVDSSLEEQSRDMTS